MRDVFHDQLDSIFDELVSMTHQVEHAVGQATKALLTADAEVAEKVISDDAVIDAARERIENSSFELLALQQPVAGELRMLVAALRMVAELERMGDLSVHVAKVARLRIPEVAVPPQLEPTISRMATVAEAMVASVADIIAERDVSPLASSKRPTMRWINCVVPRSACCSARTGLTASNRPSTSRCSVATTSGSPTMRCPWPGAWST